MCKFVVVLAMFLILSAGSALAAGDSVGDVSTGELGYTCTDDENGQICECYGMMDCHLMGSAGVCNDDTQCYPYLGMCDCTWRQSVRPPAGSRPDASTTPTEVAPTDRGGSIRDPWRAPSRSSDSEVAPADQDATDDDEDDTTVRDHRN